MDTDYLKRVGVYIVSAILSLGIIVYFGYHIWSTFKPDVKTEAVMQSTITKTVDADCYIFRYETPLSTTGSGVVVSSVSEGEKVRAGGEAAGVYSSADADTIRQIEELDVQIELLDSSSSDGSLTLKDAAKIDEDLYSVMTRIRQGLAEGDADAANNLRNELISGASKKDVIMGNSGDVAMKLSELKARRSKLVSSLGSKTATVTTVQSGYYYSTSDGYETVFDPSFFDSADYDTLKNLTSEAAPAAVSNAGKVVTSSTWYAVFFVEKGVGNQLTEGETRNVSFTYNSTSVEMKLENLMAGDDGYACIFSCSVIPEGFEFTRSQPVKLSMAEYTGFKVRISDVRVIDGQQGVYILDGSTVRFRLISVITDYEGYYIVETNPEKETGTDEETEVPDHYYLQLHDMVITEGTGLYDGRILGK